MGDGMQSRTRPGYYRSKQRGRARKGGGYQRFWWLQLSERGTSTGAPPILSDQTKGPLSGTQEAREGNLCSWGRQNCVPVFSLGSWAGRPEAAQNPKTGVGGLH
jgi:hypothetical protein